MRLALPLLVFSSLWFGSHASAAQKRQQPGYQPPPPTIVATPLALAIAGFDRDGDMTVAKAEFDAGVARSFESADKDHNGKLSLFELANWADAALGNRGALPGQFDFDRDGDDSISRGEFTALFDARFATFDKDGNKVLRRSELVTFAATTPLREERGGRARPEGPDRLPR
jgi:hypothetical protein